MKKEAKKHHVGAFCIVLFDLFNKRNLIFLILLQDFMKYPSAVFSDEFPIFHKGSRRRIPLYNELSICINGIVDHFALDVEPNVVARIVAIVVHGNRKSLKQLDIFHNVLLVFVFRPIELRLKVIEQFVGHIAFCRGHIHICPRLLNCHIGIRYVGRDLFELPRVVALRHLLHQLFGFARTLGKLDVKNNRRSEQNNGHCNHMHERFQRRCGTPAA